MIEVAALSKRYGQGQPILRDVALSIRKGEFFTLLGPSGCGKTTLLRCIAGLEAAESGRIEISGRRVLDAERKLFVPPEKRNIGMVFQSYAIWPHMSVLENVAFPARVRGLAEASKLASEALRVVEMESYAERPASQLSGGQQQRVALARAIAGKPDVLLLDEPLSNLDASLREQMRGELRRLQTELGITTILVTHDQAEALSMSDRIAIIDAGRIAEIGTPEIVYRAPVSAFGAAFLGDSIEVPIVARAQGRVSTPIGSFDLPIAEQGKDSVRLFLRPSQVGLRAAGDGGMALRVTARRFLGDGYEFDVDSQSAPAFRLRVKVAEPGDIVVGATVALVIPTSARVFV